MKSEGSMQKAGHRRQSVRTAGSLGGGQLFYFQEYRLVRRSVLGVLADVHVAYLSFLIQDEDRRVSYAVVFGGVNNSVRGDGRLFSIGEYLELRTRSLCHRPGE